MNYANSKMRPGFRKNSEHQPLLDNMDIDSAFKDLNKSNKTNEKKKVKLKVRMRAFIKSQGFYWTVIIGSRFKHSKILVKIKFCNFFLLH